MRVDNPNLIVDTTARIRPMDLVSSSIITVATATAVFTLPIKYPHFLLRIRDLVPSNDAEDLQLRLSHNNGATFDSSASNYSWTAIRLIPAGGGEGSATDTRFPLTSPGVPMGNASTEGMNGDVQLFGANQTLVRFHASWQTNFLTTTTALGGWVGCGRGLVDGPTNAIQLSMSAGNINNARIYLYGLEGL